MLKFTHKLSSVVLKRAPNLQIRSNTTFKSGEEAIKFIQNYNLTTKSFDANLKKIDITSGGDGRCTAQLTVGDEHLNSGGGLHGGFIATLVDNITTYALFTLNQYPGVTTNLQVTYYKGARSGDTVIIDAHIVKKGKNFSFADCVLKHADGSLIAKGSQTMFIGGAPFVFKT